MILIEYVPIFVGHVTFGFFCPVDIVDVSVGILLFDKSIDKPIRAEYQSGCSTLK